MKNLHTLIFPLALLLPSLLAAQIQFSRATQLLTPAKHYSGVAISVADMNGDGHDDIVRMDLGRQLAIESQTAPNRPFSHEAVGNVDIDSQWGICLGDINNDGLPEVLTGGAYDGIKLSFKLGGDYLIDQLSLPGIFVQTANFADINNDGWLDAFVCNDDSTSFILGNDGTGQLEYRPEWIDLDAVSYSLDFNSGNYGSVWSDVDNDGDLDLYVAKCRQGVEDPTDPRRINQLFWNNGDGTYTQDTLGKAGLRIGAQSWTADFGDMDNDGDFDCFITNHDVSSQLLENDGKGIFTDITAAAGLLDSVTGLTIQGLFRDFDNDGYLDILVAGTRQHLFRNNGDKTFSRVAGLLDPKNQMESCAIGDLNHDGFWDIYAGYAKAFNTPSNVPDELWMNAGNANRYLGLRLHGGPSNRSAIGAKVTLHNALGTQVREVRAGESYGISNSHLILFGLGQTTAVDSVVVRWPSGARQVLLQPAVNQYLTVFEKKCAVPAVVQSAASATTFCQGENVVLSAPEGFPQYKWSNGATSRTITASTQANYQVTVTTAEGCAVPSNIVGVVVNPVETPTVQALSETKFCEGGSVTLVSSVAKAYLWNTGETTASIEAKTNGTYTVTTQGLCEKFTSAAFPVEVLDAPEPLVQGDTLKPNTSATLTAQGDSLRWYDAPTGGVPFFTGKKWVSPPLAVSDTFWVDNLKVYDEPNKMVGMLSHQGTSFGDPEFDGAIVFDCFKPFRLTKVRVQTNVVGTRRIVLRDAKGTELQSKTLNIGNGISTIALDFDIPVGEDLQLMTDSLVNQQSFSTRGPRLRRSDQNVKYPYEIPGFVVLKNSNFDEDRYYYFFAWEADFYSYDCVSERVPVVALVDSSSVLAPEPAFAAGLRLYPNPTSGRLTVEVEDFAGGELTFLLKNALGATLHTRRTVFPSGKISQPIELGSFASGVYWLELATTAGTVQRKIVKGN